MFFHDEQLYFVAELKDFKDFVMDSHNLQLHKCPICN